MCFPFVPSSSAAIHRPGRLNVPDERRSFNVHWREHRHHPRSEDAGSDHNDDDATPAWTIHRERDTKCAAFAITKLLFLHRMGEDTTGTCHLETCYERDAKIDEQEMTQE